MARKRFRHRQRTHSIADIIIVAAFGIVLALPLTDVLLGLDRSMPFDENRVPNARPTLSPDAASLASYPKLYEAFYRDHFGYRNQLIRWHHKINKFFDTPATPMVIHGKEGWRFFANASTRGSPKIIDPFKPGQLRLWRQHLEDTRDRLRRHGAKFIVVFVPSKPTVYPEYLPDNLHRLRARGRLAQLVGYLRDNSSVEVIDLRETLFQEKKRHQIFYKYDTHWNAVGAFVGSRAILANLAGHFPSIVVPPRNEYSFTERTKSKVFPEDLLKLEGLDTSSSFTDSVFVIEPLRERRRRIVSTETWPHASGPGYWIRTITTEHADRTLPRAVMFHDSFGALVIPYIDEFFSSATFQWQYYVDEDTVRRVKPDVVILQIVERVLIEPVNDILGPARPGTRVAGETPRPQR